MISKDTRDSIIAINIMTVFVAVFILYVIPITLDRMETQAEAVRDYNCSYYGSAMNRYYGKEVCASPEEYK